MYHETITCNFLGYFSERSVKKHSFVITEPRSRVLFNCIFLSKLRNFIRKFFLIHAYMRIRKYCKFCDKSNTKACSLQTNKQNKNPPTLEFEKLSRIGTRRVQKLFKLTTLLLSVSPPPPWGLIYIMFTMRGVCVVYNILYSVSLIIRYLQLFVIKKISFTIELID